MELSMLELMQIGDPFQKEGNMLYSCGMATYMLRLVHAKQRLVVGEKLW